MRQVLYGLLGTLIGGTIVGSLGLALVCLVALGGTLAWVSMDERLPAVATAPSTQEPATRAARAPAKRTAEGNGQIRVQTMAPVVLHIDGERMPYDQGTGSYYATIGSGAHTIQVYNGWMKEVARHDVAIRSGKRLLLKYHSRDKAFTKVSETKFNQPGPAPTPVPVAVVAAPQPVAPVAYVAVPPVAMSAAPAPAPRGPGILGIFKGISGESNTRRKSTSSSKRYGEIATQAPGVQAVEGYEDNTSDEVEASEKRRFRL